ncbi:hypothetical protein [Cupriavidus taiwanensis]|uniref:hypothetical protein n=1 Tax=Cupriavidus taiwanensis TaxID=164546 RepID=UPI001C6EF94F|nr:hypothetical protein [Cupriavidus taiwanensis]
MRCGIDGMDENGGEYLPGSGLRKKMRPCRDPNRGIAYDGAAAAGAFIQSGLCGA